MKKTSKRSFTLPLLILLTLVGLGLFVAVLRFYKHSPQHVDYAILSAQNGESPEAIDATESFTLIVLPDTQKYAAKYPEIMCGQTQWIVDNIAKLNIVFVSQMGDIVDNSKEMEQWRVASECLTTLEGRIPFGIIPGNHDLTVIKGKESFVDYNRVFPASRYNIYPWYKGNFRENQNNYQIITANGMEMLFMNLEIEASDDALAWADSILKKYPDTFTIVTTHKYLPDHGSKLDNDLLFQDNGNTGKNIWEKLISKNCSVRLVLSGHYHANDGENRATHKNSCGETVNEITQDYQGLVDGGGGKLRIYTFTPRDKEISVTTYSPYTKSFERDGDSQFKFKLR